MTKIKHQPTVTILHNGEDRKVKQAEALAKGNKLGVKSIDLSKEKVSETQLDLLARNYGGELDSLVKKEYQHEVADKSDREILTLIGNNSTMLKTPLATSDGQVINLTSPRSVLTFSKSENPIDPYNHKI